MDKLEAFGALCIFTQNKKLYRAFSRQANQLTPNNPSLEGAAEGG